MSISEYRKTIKVVTKGDASTELVNRIHMDMACNYDVMYNKVTVRAKSVSVLFNFNWPSDLADALEAKYQNWYDVEKMGITDETRINITNVDASALLE